MALLLDIYSHSDADQHIRRIQDLLARDTPVEKIAGQLNLQHFDELLSIAKARLKSEKTAKDYFMLEEDLRFATNELVAEHRAKRLACDTLIEIGCGIGIQTIAFAKTCKKVIAIDIDKRKVSYAKANAAKRKLNNIHFIADDGLQAIKKLQADIIFCDPGRPAAEDVRDIETSFSPHLPTLIKEAKKLTDKIAIELPPQIKTSLNAELEYLSVDHAINRLTAYFGPLMQQERSACLLPGNVCVGGVANDVHPHYVPALQYVYEIDPALIKAQLIWTLHKNVQRVQENLLTSMEDLTNPFFKAKFKVIGTAKKFIDAKALLKREKAGKVVLHGSINHEQYWHERKKFEEGLSGTRTVHVFLGKELIVCRAL